MESSLLQLEYYIKKNKGGQIIVASNSADNIRTNRIKKTKKPLRRKTTVGIFQATTSDAAPKKTWTWLRRRNLTKEIESLLIAAQNNDRKTKCVEAKIYDNRITSAGNVEKRWNG